MRIWSIHPQYLDTKGLVAVWCEGLLAFHVLSGKTKGYTKHPQLVRFLEHQTPLQAINAYLHDIMMEAESRGYNFDRSKLLNRDDVPRILVTRGQLEYEIRHLLQKLETRDPVRHTLLLQQSSPTVHPMFELIEGPIAHWEKID